MKVKKIFEQVGVFSASLITVLTLITLVFSFILNGNDLTELLFPPPPLEDGAWKGEIEGDSVVFCFERHGNLVWGEFQWPGEVALVSIDGILDGNSLDLHYERAFHERPDKGIYRLYYTRESDGEYLRGYWKSLKDPNNRDAITLKKAEEACTLQLFPSPGGKN